MNPCVAPHIDFIPKESHGHNICKTSQSSKWLKELKPNLRVQMIESTTTINNRHFYIFEPVKLINLDILVPIFFYVQQTKFFPKCYAPVFKSNKENSKVQIGLPNHILFDNENLKVVIEEMDLTCEEIKMINGMNLLECCRGKISGKSLTFNIVYRILNKFVFLPFYFSKEIDKSNN
jgi:hypothetical protein